MKQLKIKNISLKNPLILAPMLDVTNLPFRLLCRKAGASLAFTEMIYINQILHENEKTKRMMKTISKEKPVGIQIVGSSLEKFERLVPFLKKSKFDLIDLNCSCPSTKIVGTKAGAFLLKEPEKISEIIKILKKSGKPVTVKIRLGFCKNNVLKIADVVEKAGADAITVHARLAKDSYSVPAKWDEIKKVKKVVKIPVIGNGDVFSGKDAEKMLKICDGVMIGRAALGNPLIFSEILDYFESKKEKKFDFKENIKMFREYLELCRKYEIIELQKIKFVGAHFIKGFKGASELRNKLMLRKSFKEIEEFGNCIFF